MAPSRASMPAVVAVSAPRGVRPEAPVAVSVRRSRADSLRIRPTAIATIARASSAPPVRSPPGP